MDDVVAPVGWLESDENRELENVEPVAVGDVEVGFEGNVENKFLFVLNVEFEGVEVPLALLCANDEAIFEMSELF